MVYAVRIQVSIPGTPFDEIYVIPSDTQPMAKRYAVLQALRDLSARHLNATEDDMTITVTQRPDLVG